MSEFKAGDRVKILPECPGMAVAYGNVERMDSNKKWAHVWIDGRVLDHKVAAILPGAADPTPIMVKHLEKVGD